MDLLVLDGLLLHYRSATLHPSKTRWDHGSTSASEGKEEGVGHLFMLIAWLIWKEHNSRLFDQRSYSALEVVDCVTSEV